MSKNNQDEVKPPVADRNNILDAGDGETAPHSETPTPRKNLTEQHHGENTKSVQDDRKIGQHNGAGRPPLMQK